MSEPRGAAGGGEEEDKDTEEFYDCQDDQEHSDRAEEKKEERNSDRAEEKKEEEEEKKSDRAEERREEEKKSDRLEEEGEKGESFVLEEDEKEEWQKEPDYQPPVELDDEHLREVEKDLTEEEKEGRRQQSLSMKEKGNVHFKAGEWREAAQNYTDALSLCPVCFSQERAVLFSNRAAARLHLDLKDQALSDCTRAIELKPDYVRALLRRAELYEQTEKLDEALQDYQKVVELDRGQSKARLACMRLPEQINERNEKMKAEMMSKLKDLGNMFLRPFGLSTNNFQVNQAADTGSYSINFVQNPSDNRR